MGTECAAAGRPSTTRRPQTTITPPGHHRRPAPNLPLARAKFLVVSRVGALGAPNQLTSLPPRGLGRLYGYRPQLWKTLVEAQFRGTSYQAANWIYLGETRGRGRMDRNHEAHGRAVKRIFVYPLSRNAQQ